MRLIGREAVQAQPMNALIDKGSHSMTIITLLTQREQQTVRNLQQRFHDYTEDTQANNLSLNNLEILTDAFHFSFHLSLGKTGNSRN